MQCSLVSWIRDTWRPPGCGRLGVVRGVGLLRHRIHYGSVARLADYPKAPTTQCHVSLIQDTSRGTGAGLGYDALVRSARACALCWVGILAAAAGSAATLDEARRLHGEGGLAEALAVYLDVAAAAGTKPEDGAIAANNACVVLTDLGRYPEAVASCRQALELRRRLQDPRRLARTLNNLGRALDATGERAGAEAAFREALAINRRLGDAEGEAANCTNLGVQALAMGDYDEAIHRQRQARALAEAHAGEPWAEEIVLTNRINEGAVLEKLGAPRAALARYREIAAAVEGLDAGRRAAFAANTAVLYRNLGDPVRAQRDLERAAAAYREIGDEAGLSNVHLNLALVRRLDLGDASGAEEALRTALELARASGDRGEEVQDLYQLGETLRELGRHGEAQEALEECLRLATATESAEGRWSALAGLGRLAREGGDLETALARLEEGIGVIEAVRAGLPREDRPGFFGDKRSVYRAALDVLAESSAPGEAGAARGLGVALGAKARDLTDVAGGALPVAAPPGVEDLQARLGEAVLVEYFVTEERVLLWTVTRDRVRWSDLGPAAPLLAAAASLRRALAGGEAPPGEDLAELGRRLLAAPLAAGAGAHRRWWIAPDRGLVYLPFEILPLPDGRLLMDAAEIRYLPSGALLAAPARRDASRSYALVGFGDPRLRAERASLAALAGRFSLAALPAAERELEAAARRLPGRRSVRLGEEAGEAAFAALGRQGAAVVHLAAHTVLDELSTRGPAILLAAGEGEDGLVTPAEILERPYAAGLTVLAGCQTAEADEGDGRALSSLAAAFLAAGSDAVLATLWEVGDEETAVFMEQLYHELGRGRRPADALRRVKQRLRASAGWGAPHLWSGYVLLGDAAPVVRSRRWLWVLSASAMAAALGAWRWRRRRASS